MNTRVILEALLVQGYRRSFEKRLRDSIQQESHKAVYMKWLKLDELIILISVQKNVYYEYTIL